MGHNLKILFSKLIPKKSYWGANWFQTERAEQIHLHIRNMRILLGLKEYKVFCEGIAKSWKRFQELGKGLGQPFDLLQRDRGLPEHAEFNEDLFQVELQDPRAEGDMIHFHYRNFRFHFTKAEFKEFALGTYEAYKSLSGESKEKYEDRDTA